MRTNICAKVLEVPCPLIKLVFNAYPKPQIFFVQAKKQDNKYKVQYLVYYQIYAFAIALKIVYNSMNYSVGKNNKSPANKKTVIRISRKCSDKAIYNKRQCNEDWVFQSMYNQADYMVTPVFTWIVCNTKFNTLRLPPRFLLHISKDTL